MKKTSYLERIKMIDETQKTIEAQLEKRLSLIKVGCPLFVKTASGLQDNLTGSEEAVSFYKDTENFEIVHSLAKWKREALGKYEFPCHTGLYTDMKAIRKEEIVDNIHSLYVEQWDWEKVILKEERTIDYLKRTVSQIYSAIYHSAEQIREKYCLDAVKWPKQVSFITSAQLEKMFPHLPPKQREEEITKQRGAVFIIGIGDQLPSGQVHDLRSPDYDDWALNGDLILYDEKLQQAVEVSSMGIRVDEKSLLEQLEKSGETDRLQLPYHKQILQKKLPYTIGGGIGKSRVLMLILDQSHIAQVQASSWGIKAEKQLEGLQIL